ncbi:hypothetical protein MVEN_00947300 [Mycena venus]|uniref:DUF6533 domain-containing protein n=1 Tax=Mycena venus TaxID=2733690 RepID=A0A8H6YD55_9AGAR|nr:hypothetical protein MVEN_00947300 [Mycena venus]
MSGEYEFDFEVAVGDARLANYFAASAFTILFVDFLSTIDEEINFVWKKPWSFPSGLYLWVWQPAVLQHTGLIITQNRYMTLFTIILSMPFMFREVKSNHRHGSRNYPNYRKLTRSGQLQNLYNYARASIDVALWDLRSSADFEGLDIIRKDPSDGLYSIPHARLIVILLIPETHLHGKLPRILPPLHFNSREDFIRVGHMLPGCYFTTRVITGMQFAFYAIPPLLVTFTMFILTIHKCLVTLRQDKLADLPIINLFLRDAVVWFIVVSFLYGSEMIIWATARSTLTQVLVIPSLALFSLISSRILLETRSLSSSYSNIDDEEEYQQLLPPVGSRVGWRTFK